MISKYSIILHSEVIHKTTPASWSFQKVVDKALKLSNMLFVCSKSATWKVFFIPLLAWNFLRVFVLFICESRQTNYLKPRVDTKLDSCCVPVKGFGETWMLEQDIVTSASVFLLLLMCEVLIWLLDEQISSRSNSDFVWQDRDLEDLSFLLNLFDVNWNIELT